MSKRLQRYAVFRICIPLFRFLYTIPRFLLRKNAFLGMPLMYTVPFYEVICTNAKRQKNRYC